MDINKLKEEYDQLKKLEDTDDGIFEFKDLLLESDEEAVLEFHLNIINNDEDEYLTSQLFSFYTERKNKTKASEFLHKKYKQGVNEARLLGNIIQLLGHLRSVHAKPVAMQNIKSNNKDIRYRSIIVLGWVGDEQDIDAISDLLLNDNDPQIRGYSATAMRQIWFRHPQTKTKILQYLKQVITSEDNQDALEGIIVTAQELLKRKLGLKESSYGDISGDISIAKLKTIEALI